MYRYYSSLRGHEAADGAVVRYCFHGHRNARNKRHKARRKDTRQISENKSIYITGFTEYAFESYKTFASAFLAKPITKKALKKALGNLRYPVSDITDEMIELTYQGKALIGQRLKKLTEESGMSKQELAKKLGVQHQTVFRWVNGERLPDLPMMLKIMQVLGIDKDKLF